VTSGRQTYAALLRGINVGGRARLPMPELKALLAGLGHEEVVTYIQSGNAVFRSANGDRDAIAAAIESRIVEAFGLEVAVLLRTPPELEAIVTANPFLGRETDLSRLHVVFLRAEPGPDAAARLDPARSPGDELHLAGRELYLHLPNGSGRTKLTLDYFERMLGIEGTARNWNTLLRLRALAGG
jgi:uncharacterized protein (DUF1697 family)